MQLTSTSSPPNGGFAAQLRVAAGLPVASAQHGAAPAPAAAVAVPTPGIQVANPALDPLVQRQQRYRIVGDGPLSQRTVLPVSVGAAIASARDGTSVDAVRRVLRLVEHVAGGPERSSTVPMNGVSFTDSDAGLAAATYRAHLDDDATLRRSWSELRGDRLEGKAAEFGERVAGQVRGSHANVVAGWLNLGTTASATMLGSNAPGERQLADAVRVLAHEAVHVVDHGGSGLSTRADDAWVEARAEARSTRPDQLQAARRALGLDSAVGDAALAASLAIRPYPVAERALAHAYDAAGIVPGSADEQRFLGLSNAASVDHVVARASERTGTPRAKVRTIIDEAFATAIARST